MTEKRQESTIEPVGEIDTWKRDEIRRVLWTGVAKPPEPGTFVEPEGEDQLWEIVDWGRRWENGPHRTSHRYLYMTPTERTRNEVEEEKHRAVLERTAEVAAFLFDEAVETYGAVRENFPRSGRVERVLMNYDIPEGPRGAVLRMSDGRLVAVEFREDN